MNSARISYVCKFTEWPIRTVCDCVYCVIQRLLVVYLFLLLSNIDWCDVAVIAKIKVQCIAVYWCDTIAVVPEAATTATTEIRRNKQKKTEN